MAPTVLSLPPSALTEGGDRAIYKIF